MDQVKLLINKLAAAAQTEADAASLLRLCVQVQAALQQQVQVPIVQTTAAVSVWMPASLPVDLAEDSPADALVAPSVDEPLMALPAVESAILPEASDEPEPKPTPADAPDNQPIAPFQPFTLQVPRPPARVVAEELPQPEPDAIAPEEEPEIDVIAPASQPEIPITMLWEVETPSVSFDKVSEPETIAMESSVLQNPMEEDAGFVPPVMTEAPQIISIVVAPAPVEIVPEETTVAQPKSAPKPEEHYLIAAETMEEIDALIKGTSHKPATNAEAVELNDRLAQRTRALNEMFTPKSHELAEVMAEPRIGDIRKAISINEKYQFINSLFRGEEDMFERSVKTLNNFRIFSEADFWMQRELSLKLGWNEDDELVQKFYLLVRRRFS